MKKTLLTLALAAGALIASHASMPGANREFRGAWMHTVYQGQYKQNNTEQNKAYLIGQLDSLKAMGVNAIVFQVRPSADAFYASAHEPWSRFLTDGGKAPEPYWDPLQFMIEESHKRGMELHAWLNPYRVTTSPNEKLPAGHIYNRHPERFIQYDGKIYFDPALPENRQFITDVVEDIVSRYDVDAIHFDDYFYPYPVKGVPFPDDASYEKYGNGMDLGDWRRQNVDLLIKGLNEKIKSIKPWVRFGISPFGIFRNKKNVEWGSDTNGLSNYDDLYADVLLWDREGWIDYLLPQLYWELEHKNASYLALIDWWNKNAGKNGHLYIGQDVTRTMTKKDLEPSTDANQLHHKVDLSRESENVKGNCWWPGYALTKNVGGVADSLMISVQATPAYVPEYKHLKSAGPKPVENVRLNGNTISWEAVNSGSAIEDAVRFVVYKVDDIDSYELAEGWNMVELTGEPAYSAPAPGIYVITALDRVNNESAPSAAIIVE